MSGKKQKQNKRSLPAGPEKKPFPWKKLLILIGLFLLFFFVYELVIARNQIWILHAYCVSVGVLGALYIILNRGVLSVPKKESLPADWSEAQKNETIARIRERRRRTEPILYLLIPLVLTVLVDTVSLFGSSLFGKT